MIIVYTAKRTGREFIGDSVAAVLNGLEKDRGERPEVVAIVPRMIAFFATAPERYETTEVDILVRWAE